MRHSILPLAILSRAVLPLLLSAVLAAASPARAEQPAGMVMDVTGETAPVLTPMAEIPANASVQLKSDAKLTFLHYARCKLVTVVGGTVTLTRADYKEDGKVESETDGPCPRVYSLSDSGGHNSGGIISRGMSMAPHLPADVDIIFTGSRADAITAASIQADDKPSAAAIPLSMTGPRARAPAGTPPLQNGGHYTLHLTMRGGASPLDQPFIATGQGVGQALVVLRVD